MHAQIFLVCKKGEQLNVDMFKCEPCPAGSACDINAVDKVINAVAAATERR